MKYQSKKMIKIKISAGGGKSGLGLAGVAVAVGAATDGMVKPGLGAWGRFGRQTGTGLLRDGFAVTLKMVAA